MFSFGLRDKGTWSKTKLFRNVYASVLQKQGKPVDCWLWTNEVGGPKTVFCLQADIWVFVPAWTI